jgi:hypothetical protein
VSDLAAAACCLRVGAGEVGQGVTTALTGLLTSCCMCGSICAAVVALRAGALSLLAHHKACVCFCVRAVAAAAAANSPACLQTLCSPGGFSGGPGPSRCWQRRTCGCKDMHVSLTGTSVFVCVRSPVALGPTAAAAAAAAAAS